jgi:hypothetical protein
MMKKNLLIACILFPFTIRLLTAKPVSMKDLSGDIKPVIRYYKGTTAINKLTLKLENGARITDKNGAEWELTLQVKTVDRQPDANDYQLTWTLLKGEVQGVAIGVEFPFKEWSKQNFVFIPAAVYDGNRFAVKKIDYPPYWYNKNEWRLDMPTTTTVQPTLGIDDGSAKIEANTGNATTPLMAFHSPNKQIAWMVLTTQGSRFGNHGLSIVENIGKSEAQFSITAPAVREMRALGAGFAPSGDTPANWKPGDSLTIHFRVYAFKAPKVKDMLKRFSEIRKDINPSTRHEVLPFSEARKLVNNLYQQDRWDERINMFCLSKPGIDRTWNYIWQLGWCGGGQCTLPIMMQGSEIEKQRALSNLDVIFSKSQAKSGFFNAFGNGIQFASFGFGSAFKHNETFVRSQGDWLYMAQRQFQFIESKGGSIPTTWKLGLRKLADAFTSIWNKYGEFGQFVDVETGDICIGGSTSGAIVSGALALASQTYDSPLYLEIAKKSARKFYTDFVLKGYTTGGPAEILSAPDSESAFGLFESFMALYEVTKEKEWLKYASDLLPICASWTVSYDYQFPSNSPMGTIDARSCGSVWASVANKHSAPGICTWSGDCLLKYYRASGDYRALQLLTDIAHGLPQYISRIDRPIGNMPPGSLCERVNLSDWEGKQEVGGNIFGSCSWVETAALLTVTQLPGLYVQPDKGVFAVFDNIRVEKISYSKGKLNLRLNNPTKFPADVKVLVESSVNARKKNLQIAPDMTKIIRLEINETKDILFQ